MIRIVAPSEALYKEIAAAWKDQTAVYREHPPISRVFWVENRVEQTLVVIQVDFDNKVRWARAGVYHHEYSDPSWISGFMLIPVDSKMLGNFFKKLPQKIVTEYMFSSDEATRQGAVRAIKELTNESTT